jgi:hypothetical protein
MLYLRLPDFPQVTVHVNVEEYDNSAQPTQDIKTSIAYSQTIKTHAKAAEPGDLYDYQR